MVLIDGKDFVTHLKRIHFMMDATPSSAKIKHGNDGLTQRIFELHIAGQKLLLSDRARLHAENSVFKVDWRVVGDLSYDRIREWEESLSIIVSGLRCEQLLS